jgi:hypothetical protein
MDWGTVYDANTFPILREINCEARRIYKCFKNSQGIFSHEDVEENSRGTRELRESPEWF